MKYEEDYVAALDCFARAQALDPTWSEPKEQELNLVSMAPTMGEEDREASPISTQNRDLDFLTSPTHPDTLG